MLQGHEESSLPTVFKVLACFLTLLTALLVTSCGKLAKPAENDTIEKRLPSWVANPKVSGGIAASACSLASGSFLETKALAIHRAEEKLLSLYISKLEQVEKTYKEKHLSKPPISLTNGVNQNIKQLTTNARAVKVNYVDINQEQHLCVMLALSPIQTNLSFNALLDTIKPVLASGTKKELLDLFLSDRN